MYRLFTTVAVYKLFIAIILYLTTTLDPVMLVSSIFMALSAIIVRVVQEREVGIVLVALILLIDAIGLILSFISLILVTIVAYVVVLLIDTQIILLFRQQL